MARAALQANLKKRFSKVVSKRGSVLLGLWGQAGVGKSWLATQLLREVPCLSVSVPATTGEAELARALPRSENLPLWVENRLEQLASGETTEIAAITDALAAQLVALAPLILHIEDWHDASAEQLERWRILARAVRRSRGVGLLVTSRREPPKTFEAERLEPLTPRGSNEMLEVEAKASLPDPAQTWIYERARGNPLFTLEYFSHLTRHGFLWSDGQRWRWRTPDSDIMPTSIEALIAQRLRTGARSPEERLVLDVKALLPTGLDDDLYAKVAGLEPGVLQEATLYLEEQSLLREEDFAHPLIREVALRELPQTQRRQLARRAVEVLRVSHPEEAADLVTEADLTPAEAERMLKRAAEAARAMGKENQAASFMALATQYVTGHEQVQLALEAAEQLRHVNLPEAARLSELALKADPHSEAAIFLRAKLLSSLGEGEDAEALLRTLPPERQMETDWLEALIEVQVNRYDYAGTWEVWLENPKLREVATVPARVHISQALTQLGEFAQARAFLEEAMKTLELKPLERARLQSTYGLISGTEGDFEASISSLSSAIETFSIIMLAESVDEHAAALLRRSAVLYRRGQYQEAIADLEIYLQLVSEQGNGSKYAKGEVNLGACLIEVGEFQRSEEVLLESRSVLERSGDIRWLASVEWQLVQLYLDWAPPYGAALALRHAQAAESYARRAQSPPLLAETLCFVSRTEAMHGKPKRALEFVEELQALATRLGETRLAVVGTWVRGLALEKLDQQEAALQTLEEAVSQMKQLGHEPFANRLALEVDRIQNDMTAAAVRTKHFKHIGNLNWLNIAHRYFPQLSSTPTPTKIALVHLRVLGPLQIERDGSSLSYYARQGKLLLAHLLEARIAGRSEVSRLDLIDSLYPDTDEKQAAAALKQLVYRLRSTLSTEAVMRTSNGYALGDVSSDAEAFLQSGDTNLWRGPYLEDLEAWTSSTQDALYHALHLQVAERLKQTPQEASRLSQLLLEADPYDLEALFHHLRAQQTAGNIAGLERLYQRHREHFSEVGEHLPGDWDTFLQNYAAQTSTI